jgi:hypothetical protein
MKTEAGKRLLERFVRAEDDEIHQQLVLEAQHPEAGDWDLCTFPLGCGEVGTDIDAIEAEARATALAEAAERVRGRMAAIAGVPHDHGHTDACTACLRDGVLRAVLAILEER